MPWVGSQLPAAAIDPTAATPAVAINPAAAAVDPPATAVDPAPTTVDPTRLCLGTGRQRSQNHPANHGLRPFLETLEEIPSVEYFGLFCPLCSLLCLGIFFHAATSPAL